MKIKRFISVAFLFTIVLASCKKEEKDDTVTDDPRVRVMNINNISNAFVVNDTKGEIFNYDSLSYGTKIDALHPYFSGYIPNLRYQYKKGNQWVDYTSADTLDFTTRVWIKVIAPDSNYTKEYEIDIRVHRYDVEGFQWEEGVQLPVQNVVSQKTYFYQKKFYLFYRDNAGGSYLLVSTDNGERWTPPKTLLPKGSTTWEPDWRTLTFMHYEQTLAVQDAATGILYVCNNIEDDNPVFASSETVLPGNAILKTPLFTLRNNFWVIAEEGSNRFLYYLPKDSTKYIKKEQLLPDISIEDANIFTALSGSSVRLGYIISKNQQAEIEVWAIDANGNIQKFSAGQSAFPFRTGIMPVFFGNKLYIAGGTTGQDYSNKFYETSNSGVSWSEDNHKFLPVGVAGGSIFEYERNKIILIGGQTKDGFRYVWKGVLKLEILEGRY